MRQHYVYIHRKQTDGAIFYVGKGKDRRAWATSGRNPHWRNIQAKHGFEVHIVRANLPETCALSFERAMIAAIGKGLANLTDGGGGATGWKHSAEAKARIAEAGKGRKNNARQRAALDLYNATKVISDEHKRRMSAARKGRKFGPRSAETRAKISASHMGMRPTPETLRKLSAAKVGKAVGRSSPSYDHTIRHWRNDDGREFSGTRGDMIAIYKLGDPCVSAVIKGRQKSVKGWRLK